MPRVIISSGHTEKDPGSKANDLVEYEVARDIAKRVLPHLRANGIIALSVPPNLDLLKRLDWINNTGYEDTNNDLALEIHINEGGKRGIEVWYEGNGENNSKKLADLLLTSVSKEASLPKQGSRSEFEHEFGSIAFLHDANPVTALVECCYIDNEEDARFLKNEKNLEKLAKGIAKGVLEYYGVEFREGQQTGTTQPNPDPTPQTQPANQNQAPATTPTPPSPPTQPNQMPNFGGGSQMPQMGGMPGMPGGFGGGMPGMGGGMGNQPSDNLTREQRQEMIKANYVKILGREPNPNDLNYFLNIGITEQDLVKKMIESQEHADLVKARQEIIKIKEESASQKNELLQLRAQTEDQKNIIVNLQGLLSQKNTSLAQMQQKVNAVYANSQTVKTESPGNNNTVYKGTFLDKLFKAFSDLFE